MAGSRGLPISLTGTTALSDHLDERCVVVLRDGRHLVGHLRSFDQYSNLILDGVVERKFAKGKYHDDRLGLLIVRSENIVLVGAVEGAPNDGAGDLEQADAETVQRLQREDAEEAAARKQQTAQEGWGMDDTPV